MQLGIGQLLYLAPEVLATFGLAERHRSHLQRHKPASDRNVCMIEHHLLQFIELVKDLRKGALIWHHVLLRAEIVSILPPFYGYRLPLRDENLQGLQSFKVRYILIINAFLSKDV